MSTIAKIYRCERYDQVGEPTTSYVIPTDSFSKEVPAIDVTALPEHKRIQVATLWNSYQEYVETMKRSIFSFEDFVNHTTNTDIAVKWTQVTPEQLKK